MTAWDLELQVYEEYLDYILEGDKTVEARAPKSSEDDRYSDLGKDDTLKLWTDDGKSAIYSIEDVEFYESALGMLEKEGWARIVPEANSLQEAVNKCHNISDDYEERIREHGIYAIELGDRLD